MEIITGSVPVILISMDYNRFGPAGEVRHTFVPLALVLDTKVLVYQTCKPPKRLRA